MYNQYGLKHCPFCGATDTEIQELPNADFKGHTAWIAGCPNCGVWTDYCDTKKAAVNIWNRRFPRIEQPPEGAIRPIKAKEQDSRYMTIYECPACGGKILGTVSNYCYHCGQAFDLNKEEEK